MLCRHKNLCLQDAQPITLMEVFNIVYLGRDKLVPEKQVGTVIMKFDGAVQNLYNVKEVDVKNIHSSIEYKDDIVVAIKAPPAAFTELAINFDLFDSAYKGSVVTDWDPDRDDSYIINYWRERIISADGLGSISVSYGLFGNGTIAEVEIKCDFDANDVYGVVAAYNSKLDHLDCVSTLLVKKSDNMIEIRNGDPMPLSRSRVAVPLGYFFHVIFRLQAAGNKVYEGTVEFDARRKGSIDKDVAVEAGKINVRVTWITNLKSIGNLYDVKTDGTYDEYDSESSVDPSVDYYYVEEDEDDFMF